jgi:hypothetical protein
MRRLAVSRFLFLHLLFPLAVFLSLLLPFLVLTIHLGASICTLVSHLKEEHGFTGGYSIVKSYVSGEQLRSREMFVPRIIPT